MHPIKFILIGLGVSAVVIFVFIFIITPRFGVQRPNPHPTAPCDLNFDGVCDCKDFLMFQKAFGGCFRSNTDYDKNYDVRADANANGCVDASDRALLFPGNTWDACLDQTK